MKLAAGGGFVHNLYVQPHGYSEASIPGCTVTRATKVEAWKQRRAREAVKAVREGYTTAQMPQAGWFVLAEAHRVLGEQQDARDAWQHCSVLQHSKDLGALCAHRLTALADTPLITT